MLKRIVITAFGLLCVAGTAAAAPLALPANVGLYIKFNNIELVDTTGANSLVVPAGYAPATAAGPMGNWGVVVVSTIQYATIINPNELLDADSGLANLFTNTPGAGGAQITGIFYGIDLTSATTATTGHLDLFWQEGTSLSTNTSNPGTAAGLFTAGTRLASIAFEPGILGPADCVTSVATTTNSITSQTGVAESFGEVNTLLPGVWMDSLNGNWFTNSCGGTSDIRFKNSFNRINNAANAWNGNGTTIRGFISDDPAQAFTAVPEPASLALLGIGLAGLAMRLRRKVA